MKILKAPKIKAENANIAYNEPVEELKDIVQETFAIEKDFSLQFQDQDGQFFTLLETDEIKDKDTIKDNNIESRRDTVIRGLIIYLGEKAEELIKDYQ
ncbi:hypothetical protein cypCar_00048119, partial [Cyprinus carpio]